MSYICIIGSHKPSMDLWYCNPSLFMSSLNLYIKIWSHKITPMPSELQPCTYSWNLLRISFMIYLDARLYYIILLTFWSTPLYVDLYVIAPFNDYFLSKKWKSSCLNSNRHIFSLSLHFKSFTHFPTLWVISITSYKISSKEKKINSTIRDTFTRHTSAFNIRILIDRRLLTCCLFCNR